MKTLISIFVLCCCIAACVSHTRNPAQPIQMMIPGRVDICDVPPVDISNFHIYGNVAYNTPAPPQTFSDNDRSSTRTLSIVEPDSTVPLPVVVRVHGGAWERGKGYDPDLDAIIAQFGYAVVSLNYRLVAQQDGSVITDPPDYNAENAFPAGISDLRCAMRWLKLNAAAYNLDMTRLGVLGGSAGGQLAMLLTVHDGLFDDATCPGSSTIPAFKVAIGYYGVYDVRSSAPFDVLANPSYPVNAISQMLGAPMDTSVNRFLASPITHVNGMPQVVMFHGTDDQVIPTSQAQTFQEALLGANVQALWIELPGLQHGFPMVVDGTKFVANPALATATCTTLAALSDALKQQ